MLSTHLQRTTGDRLGIKRYDFVKAFVRANPAVGKRILPVGVGGWVSMTSGEFLFPMGVANKMFVLSNWANTLFAYSLVDGRVRLAWSLRLERVEGEPYVKDKATLMARLKAQGRVPATSLSDDQKRILFSTACLATYIFTRENLVYFVAGPGIAINFVGTARYHDKMIRLPTSDFEKSKYSDGPNKGQAIRYDIYQNGGNKYCPHSVSG